MKRLLISMLTVLFLSGLSFAADGLELGLFSPIQLSGIDKNIEGARFGLFYTQNKSVKGFDLNIFVSNTSDRFEGLQVFGLLNYNEGRFYGFRALNFVNYTQGRTRGYSVFSTINVEKHVVGGRFLSLLNYADKLNGVDLGAVNVSKSAKGIQIGVFNYADWLDGVQIGVINFAMNSAIFPVFPVINFNKSF